MKASVLGWLLKTSPMRTLSFLRKFFLVVMLCKMF
jgi:hypothetical protein